MKRLIIFILICLLIPLVNAQFNALGKTGNETFDNLDNWSQISGDDDCELEDDMLECENQMLAYDVFLPNVTTNTNNYSCAFDMAIDNIANGYYVAFFWATFGTDDRFTYGIHYVNSKTYLRRMADGDLTEIPDVFDDSTWQDWKITFTTDYTIEAYINGTLKATSNPYELFGAYKGEPRVWEWRAYDSSDEIHVDNFTCFNGTNYPAGFAPPDTLPPIIVIDSPPNSSIYNRLPIEINVTPTDAEQPFIICHLRNETHLIDESSVASGSRITFDYDEGEEERDILFNITCFDNEETNNNSATVIWNITIDTIIPLISISTPSSGQNFDKTYENITYDASCFDNFVYKFNITITNTSNQILSILNESVGYSTLNINGFIDSSNMGVGEYFVNFSCSDSHTSNSIGDYIISKNDSDKSIEFIDENTKISIKMINQPLDFVYNTVKTSKLKDRYLINFDEGKKAKSDYYTFELKSNKEIDYITTSGYDAHFVTGENWVDFENDDPKSMYSVDKITDFNYRIAIFTNDLNFNSIGGLNIVYENYSITVSETFLITEEFSVTECPVETTAQALIFWMIALISIVFILVGVFANNGLFGLFGALMMFVVSWYLFACIIMFAYILMLVSVVLIIYFPLMGLSSK